MTVDVSPDRGTDTPFDITSSVEAFLNAMEPPRRNRVESAVKVLLTLIAERRNGAAGTVYRDALLTECTTADYTIAAGTGRVTIVTMADARSE